MAALMKGLSNSVLLFLLFKEKKRDPPKSSHSQFRILVLKGKKIKSFTCYLVSAPSHYVT